MSAFIEGQRPLDQHSCGGGHPASVNTTSYQADIPDMHMRVYVAGFSGSGVKSLAAKLGDDSSYYIEGLPFTKTVEINGKTLLIQFFPYQMDLSNFSSPLDRKLIERLRTGDALVLVCDKTDLRSFRNLSEIFTLFERWSLFQEGKTNLYLAATKHDQFDEHVIETDELKKYQSNSTIPIKAVAEVSSKTGENVDLLFKRIVKDYIQDRIPAAPKPNLCKKFIVPAVAICAIAAIEAVRRCYITL